MKTQWCEHTDYQTYLLPLIQRVESQTESRSARRLPAVFHITCPPAGEEVLLIQEKLDGIKSRYAEMTACSSKALRTLEQALQLATRFASAHDDLNQWLDGVEAELSSVDPDATPAYQDRQKVGGGPAGRLTVRNSRSNLLV